MSRYSEDICHKNIEDCGQNYDSRRSHHATCFELYLICEFLNAALLFFLAISSNQQKYVTTEQSFKCKHKRIPEHRHTLAHKHTHFCNMKTYSNTYTSKALCILYVCCECMVFARAILFSFSFSSFICRHCFNVPIHFLHRERTGALLQLYFRAKTCMHEKRLVSRELHIQS